MKSIICEGKSPEETIRARDLTVTQPPRENVPDEINIPDQAMVAVTENAAARNSLNERYVDILDRLSYDGPVPILYEEESIMQLWNRAILLYTQEVTLSDLVLNEVEVPYHTIEFELVMSVYDFVDDCLFVKSNGTSVLLIYDRKWHLIQITDAYDYCLVFNSERITQEDAVFWYMRNFPMNPQSGKVGEEIENSTMEKKEYAQERYYSRKNKKIKALAKAKEKMPLKIDYKSMDKKQRKKFKNLEKKILTPQAGNDDDVVSSLLEVVEGKNLDSVIMMFTIIEKLLLQYYVVYGTSTVGRVLLQIAVFYKNSIIYDVIKTIMRISQEECIWTATLATLKDMFAKMHEGWSSLKLNKHAVSFAGVCAMAVTSILCPTAGSSFDAPTYQKMSENVTTFLFKGDLISGLISSGLYITNAVELFVRTGSLEGFLVTEDCLDELALEHIRLISQFELYQSGDLEFIKGSKHYVFLKDLDDFIGRCEKVRPASQGVNQRTITAYLKEAEKMITESVAIEKHKSTRMAPYAFLVLSPTGTNKSHLTKAFVMAILRANGFEFEDDYLFFYNDADAYVSGWKNYTTGIIADDMANSRPLFEEGNGANFILKCINNQPHNLLGAAVKDKGSQWNRAKVFAASSNNAHQHYSAKSSYASTQERRLALKIIVSVREEYCRRDDEGNLSSIIDYDRMTPEMRASPLPDAWLFTLMKVDVRNTPVTIKDGFTAVIPSTVDSDWKWSFIKNAEGKPMTNIPMQTLLEFLVADSKKHFTQQEDVIDASAKLRDTPICDTCGIYKCSCRCEHKPAPVSPNLPVSVVSSTDASEDENMRLNADLPDISELCNYPARRNNFGRRRGPFGRGPQSGRCEKQGIKPQSWMAPREIRYMQKGIKSLRKLRDKNIRHKLGNALLMLQLGRTTGNEALAVLEDYFDSFASMCIVALTMRMSDSVVTAFKSGTDMISRHLEGTPVGAVLRCDTTSAKILGTLDLGVYRCAQVAVPVLTTAYKIVSLPRLLLDKALNGEIYESIGSLSVPSRTYFRMGACKDMNLINLYYAPRVDCVANSKNLVTKAYISRLRRPIKVKEKRTLEGSIYDSAMLLSEAAREEKNQIPDLIRDEVLPFAMLAYVVRSLIPKYYEKMHDLYITRIVRTQAGMNMTISEVAVMDRLEDNPEFVARAQAIMDPTPVETHVKSSELVNIVENNVLYVRCNVTGDCTMGASPCSGIIIVPAHFFKLVNGHVLTFVRKPTQGKSKPLNSIYHHIVDSSNVVVDKAHDLAYMKISNTGYMKDIRRYFPSTHKTHTTSGKLVWRNANGVLNTTGCSKVNYCNETSNDSSTALTFPGYTYNAVNFPGLCCAFLIDDAKKHSFIMGLHIGGNVVSQDAVAVTITSQELEQNVALVMKGEQVIKQSGFNLQAYGKDLYEPGYHVKSPMMNMGDDLGNLRVLGRVNIRHKVVPLVIKTPICDDLREIMNHGLIWGAPPIYGPNNDDKKFASKEMFRKILSTKGTIPPKILAAAKSDYLSGIMGTLNSEPERWREELRPLTDDETVQGIDGVAYMNAMNMSSSIGKHLSGKKSKFAKLEGGKWHFDPEIMEDFDKRMKKMENGERSWECVFAMPKVEPMLEEKIKKGKTRMFFATDAGTQMIIRKLMLSLTRFFCTQGKTSECAVGINTSGTRWNDVVSFLKEILGENYIALDFAHFDLGMLAAVLEACIDICIEICKWTGNYTSKQMTALYVLKQELLNNIVDVNGDLVQLIGVILSGVNLTSLFGCIANSLLIRVAVFTIYPLDHPIWKKYTFADIVRILTYGDDMVGKVKKGYEDINVDNILKVLASYGVKATNCFKTDAKVTYMKLSELEFLKRSFVYMPEFKTYVAPLAEASIFKMLSCILPPKENVSVESVTAANIDNALYEYKFHGRCKYEKMRVILRELAQKHELRHMCKFLGLTFDDMLGAWNNKYNPLVTKSNEAPGLAALRLWIVENYQANYLWSFKTANTTSLVDVISTDEGAEGANNKPLGMDIPEMKQQSGNITASQEQVLTFEDESTIVEDVGSNDARSRIGASDIGLAEFLARPVQIAQYSWSNLLFAERIYPWAAFLNNKRVVNRICNYKLFKGNCHVKILVNGNSFFYGRLMASYWPLQMFDSLSSYAALTQEDRISQSQLPTIYLNPTTSEAGEMILPFMYHEDYINLTTLTNPSRELGELIFSQLNVLRNANNDISSSSEALTVTVYAWMTEVELESPTSLPPFGITPQAGKVKGRKKKKKGAPKEEDQTTDKPISQLATAVGSAAGALSVIPVLAPYTLPLAAGAAMVSNVASALGFSRPALITEPANYTPLPFDSLAVCNTTAAVQKMTMDAKQGLSVDATSYGGRTEDEMTVAFIAQRESFWYTFDWGMTNVPGNMLSNLRVTPASIALVGSPQATIMTAVAGVSLPFDYWTGTLVYRLEIVCSGFHRGRLAVLYDTQQTPTVREDNIGYTAIIDITDSVEYTIEISNHQSTAWLARGNSQTVHHSPVLLSSISYITNGCLSFWVLNQLAVPNYDSTVNQDIQINVYVSGGKDFKVAKPGGATAQYVVKPVEPVLNASVRPQAGNDGGNDETIPIKEEHVETAPADDNLMYIGEEIQSLRLLMKRYVPHRYFITEDSRISETTMSMYPVYRGNVIDAMHVTLTGIYNFTVDGIINYMRPAYLCTRGGMRYKMIQMLGTRESSTIITVTRTGPTPAGEAPFFVPTSILTGSRRFIVLKRCVNSLSGNCGTLTGVNPSFAFEVPFYSLYKFVPGKPERSDAEFADSIVIALSDTLVTGIPDDRYELHASAAEDFSLTFFSGWPRMYYEATPPL